MLNVGVLRSVETHFQFSGSGPKGRRGFDVLTSVPGVVEFGSQKRRHFTPATSFTPREGRGCSDVGETPPLMVGVLHEFPMVHLEVMFSGSFSLPPFCILIGVLRETCRGPSITRQSSTIVYNDNSTRSRFSFYLPLTGSCCLRPFVPIFLSSYPLFFSRVVVSLRPKRTSPVQMDCVRVRD